MAGIDCGSAVGIHIRLCIIKGHADEKIGVLEES